MISGNRTRDRQPVRFVLSVLCITAISILFTTGVGIADPYFTPDEGKIPLTVQFTLPGGENCDRVSWDFGDGNTSQKINPSYTYKKMGFFFPSCTCTLPGATVTYSFDKIVPANADMSDKDTNNLHYPTGVSPQVQTESLSLQDLITQGTGLYALGRYEEAASSYRKAAQLSKDDPEILAMYGTILAGLSRWDEAENVYNQSLAINRDMTVLNAYGGVLTKLRKYEEALTAFNQSREQSSANPGSWAGTARVYLALKNMEEAAIAYKNSLDTDQNQPSVWKEYGDVLGTLKRDEEAVAAYEKAISQGVNGADIYYKYGEVLRSVGRNGDAQNAIAKARSMQGPLYSSISDSVPICTSASGVM